MKILIQYKIEDEDDSFKWVSHALNRLTSFTKDGIEIDERGTKAYNNIIKNKIFEQKDISALTNYLLVLAARAKAKCEMDDKNEAQDSVIQAADNAIEMANQIHKWFVMEREKAEFPHFYKQNLPEELPIND